MGWSSQRWLLLPLGALALLLLALLLPVEQLQEGERPLVALESHLFLSNGSTARQTVILDGPPSEQVAFRVWALLEPSDAPYLYARCTSAGRLVGQGALPLPANDRAYHALDTPWCDTLGQRNLALTLEGNGVRLMTTAVDRVPGALFRDEASQLNSDLVLQLRQRAAGVDRYLPVSRWSANKPGIFGWPRLYLLLPALYLVLMAVIVGAARRGSGIRGQGSGVGD